MEKLHSNEEQAVLLEEANYLRRESDDRLKYGHEYGQEGLKGLFLANGSAIVALLTFIGHATTKVDPRGITWSFVWFVLGLVACLTSYFFQYLTQDHIMNATHNEALQKKSIALGWGVEYNFVLYKEKSRITLRLSIVLGLASLALFSIGAFVALVAIT